MTAKERARMVNLAAENRELRERLDQSIAVYRSQALELIELRARLEAIRTVMEEPA